MSLVLDIAALLPRIPQAELPKFAAWYEKYGSHLSTIGHRLYDRLPAADQARFLVWFLKRWAKIDLVNRVERDLYTATIQRVKTEPRQEVALDGRPYLLRDFRSQGYDFTLLGYDWFLGVHDIMYNQYEHADVVLRPGDVIIDAGAFIGDTAVFFHHRLQGDCQIHSFELLDENLALLVDNLQRNGVREEQVTLNKLALTDRTGDEIIMSPGASQGSTSIFGRDTAGDRVQTITIDDYVVAANLERVDYIKMDIEGAEVAALRGAHHTIMHFKPRLAICLYHKWDDVLTIPQAILDTGVDYQFGFKWVQLSDGWEAVLHASPLPAGVTKPTVPEPATPADRVVGEALAALCAHTTRQQVLLDTMRRNLRDAAMTVAQPAATVSAA